MSGYADTQDPAAVLAAAPKDRPGRQTTEELMQAAGWKLQGVNWVYEKVTGEDLIESLINPLLGDFEKIDENAAAWDNIAKSLDAVRNNLNSGLGELEPHWEGEAAQSFERHISVVWTVAIEADSQIARLIGQKFQSVANTCRTMTKVALFLLDKLCSKLLEAAITAALPVAWARVVLMVKDAIDIVDAIRKIILAIQTIIEGVQAMIDGIRQMGTALMKIKDVNSVNDAMNVLDDVQDGKQTFDDGAKAAQSGAISAGLGAYSGVRGANALGKHNSMGS